MTLLFPDAREKYRKHWLAEGRELGKAEGRADIAEQHAEYAGKRAVMAEMRAEKAEQLAKMADKRAARAEQISEHAERRAEQAERRADRAERATNRAWYSRQQDALRRGESFDEPPPWVDDEDGGDAGDGQ